VGRSLPLPLLLLLLLAIGQPLAQGGQSLLPMRRLHLSHLDPRSSSMVGRQPLHGRLLLRAKGWLLLCCSCLLCQLSRPQPLVHHAR
jgi:hypothetical protein